MYVRCMKPADLASQIASDLAEDGFDLIVEHDEQRIVISGEVTTDREHDGALDIANSAIANADMPGFRVDDNIEVSGAMPDEAGGADLLAGRVPNGEVFGPCTVLVEYDSRDELLALAESWEGQLTATIHGRDDEVAAQDIRQPDPGLVGHALHDLPAQRVHAVADDHRPLEQRRLQRGQSC